MARVEMFEAVWLVNRRLAYVAVSQGRYDAQIYTNDAGQLREALGRDATHHSAVEIGDASSARSPNPSPTIGEPEQNQSDGWSR